MSKYAHIHIHMHIHISVHLNALRCEELLESVTSRYEGLVKQHAETSKWLKQSEQMKDKIMKEHAQCANVQDQFGAVQAAYLKAKIERDVAARNQGKTQEQIHNEKV